MAASPHLIFIPSPLTGHLKSTVEIARILIHRAHRLSITILFINLPLDPNATHYIRTLTAPPRTGRIRFLLLPPKDDDGEDSSTKPLPRSFAAMMELHKPRVAAAVTELTNSPQSGFRLAGFVVDMFCTSMIDVANEFGVPSYIYYTSGAGFLALALHVRALSDDSGCELAELDPGSEFDVPGFVNRVPLAKVLPSAVVRSKEGSESFVNRMRRFGEVKGILVNSFAELESYALDSLFSSQSDGIPAMYPVGPILDLRDENGEGGDRTAIEEWLDKQPARSVVFLCFGSWGSFGAEQLKEIADGIERSGLRFLWSVRRPPAEDALERPGEYANPEKALSEGFLKRTAGTGKIVGWAPQVKILSHPAIGGFVSHCGWNSVLESLWFGVPIATWPMYAEQQANAFTVARELGLAAEITMDYRKDATGNSAACPIVSAEDVEGGIRRVMELDSAVRAKVEAVRLESRKAMMEGGSSYKWLGRFIDDVMNSMA